jgi:hypothetical protein
MPNSVASDAARRLIPGAYEQNTATHRQAGSMGAPQFGFAPVEGTSDTMSPATVLDRQMEGGGGVSQRPPQDRR